MNAYGICMSSIWYTDLWKDVYVNMLTQSVPAWLEDRDNVKFASDIANKAVETAYAYFGSTK